MERGKERGKEREKERGKEREKEMEKERGKVILFQLHKFKKYFLHSCEDHLKVWTENIPEKIICGKKLVNVSFTPEEGCCLLL